MYAAQLQAKLQAAAAAADVSKRLAVCGSDALPEEEGTRSGDDGDEGQGSHNNSGDESSRSPAPAVHVAGTNGDDGGSDGRSTPRSWTVKTEQLSPASQTLAASS